MASNVMEQRAALARREDPDELLGPPAEPVRADKTLLGRPLRRPSWCSSLAQQQWVEFREVLVPALADAGVPYPQDDDPRHVYITASDGHPSKLAVRALVESVAHLPSARWESEIIRLVGARRASIEDARRGIFARGADHVRSVMWPLLVHAGQAPDVPGLLRRTHGDDLVALLEVQAGGHRHYVHRADAIGWGTSAEALWSAAMHNLEQQHHELEPGPLGLLTGESDYVASHVLRVGDLIGHPAPCGVFAVVPNPHVVFVHVLGDGGGVVMEVLEKLPRLVAGSYGGRYPQLSPNVYWWADGVLERLMTTDGCGVVLDATVSARCVGVLEGFLHSQGWF